MAINLNKPRLILTVSFAFAFATLMFILNGVFFPKKAAPLSWIGQANSLGQVGDVLQAYLEAHENSAPFHISTLKKWASTQKSFQDADQSAMWSFIDPNSGITYDWIMCPHHCKAFRIYAPRMKTDIDGRQVPARLVLTTMNKWKFIPENEFEAVIAKELNEERK